jgi:hypothetical protein
MTANDVSGAELLMHQHAGIEIDQEPRLLPGMALLLYLALALLTWAAVILVAWGLWTLL